MKLNMLRGMIVLTMTSLIVISLHVPNDDSVTTLMSREREAKLEMKAEQKSAVENGTVSAEPHLDWYIIPRTFNSNVRISEGLHRGMQMQEMQRRNAAFSKKALANQWTFIGPSTIGGRIRTLAYHPTDPTIVYAGSASGGVFKSTNGGDRWTAMSDHLPTLAIGHIAIDKNNPDHIYAGTGEGSYNWDKVYGDGLYKSTDGGLTWNNIMLDVVGESDFAINHVELHPTNPDYIYVAASFGGQTGGVLRTTDGGESWSTVLNGPARSVRLDPLNANRVYCAFGYYNGRSSNGLYVSEEKGDRWTFNKLNNNLPDPDSIGNVVMDITTRVPGLMIVAMQRARKYCPNESEDFLGVFRSTDYGENWEKLPSSTQGNMKRVMRGQGDYNFYIRFHPTDQRLVFLGGIHSWRSTNTGESFSQFTKQTGTNGAWVDMHDVAFSPTNPDHMLMASDGGVFRCTDVRASSAVFEEVNQDLGTMQFYAMDFDRSDPDRIAGGTQDRRNNLGSARTGEWSRLSWGGDGAYVAFDYEDPDIFYVTSQYGNLGKTTNGGESFKSATKGLVRTVSGENVFSFVTPFIMHPTDPKTLFIGGNKIYRTEDGMGIWEPISEDLTGSLSSLAQFQDLSFCKADPNILYGVTGYSTRAWRTTNAMDDSADVVWERIDDGIPNLFMGEVEVHPTNGDIAYVGTNAFSDRSGVYKTTDGGKNWEFMKGETEATSIPFIPVSAIAIWEENPDVVYAGTDLGVYVSTDAGMNWYPFGEGLPNVVIDDLKITGDDILYAATHGRGMWMVPAIPVITDVAESTRPLQFSLGQNYPNPFNPSTVIPFHMETAGNVTMRIYDTRGRLLRTVLNEHREAGEHTARVSATGLQSGVYIYELRAGSHRETRKMMVMQ